MKALFKVEYQRERKKDFQKYMNDVVRVDAPKQRLNLMLVLYEKKTIFEAVSISVIRLRYFLRRG